MVFRLKIIIYQKILPLYLSNEIPTHFLSPRMVAHPS